MVNTLLVRAQLRVSHVQRAALAEAPQQQTIVQMAITAQVTASSLVPKAHGWNL